uniref:Uncharacterized protein n=1 Tax=Utricularia reniformis TaxID=192314 RepID=A0A1Y0B1P8_9LAMI|nr:hypothetical protein AEK19_MT1124 [Utricularia reniformis]ART31340.1 hypothetical protein AEK19_MT1124 [Utricularia reniformis]
MELVLVISLQQKELKSNQALVRLMFLLLGLLHWTFTYTVVLSPHTLVPFPSSNLAFLVSKISYCAIRRLVVLSLGFVPL